VATSLPEVTPESSYEDYVAELGRHVLATQQYWTSQGVDVTGTRVEVLEGDEEITCDKTYYSTDEMGGYCYDINTFFVTEAFIHYLNSDRLQPRMPYELSRLEVTVAHEYGHVVQYILHDTEGTSEYLANQITFEQQADCYAGRTIRAIDPEAAGIVMHPEFTYMPGSNIHGSTEEREASFLAGFNAGGCIVTR
jgi:hypothetical protein